MRVDLHCANAAVLLLLLLLSAYHCMSSSFCYTPCLPVARFLGNSLLGCFQKVIFLMILVKIYSIWCINLYVLFQACTKNNALRYSNQVHPSTVTHAVRVYNKYTRMNEDKRDQKSRQGKRQSVDKQEKNWLTDTMAVAGISRREGGKKQERNIWIKVEIIVSTWFHTINVQHLRELLLLPLSWWY